ncbi:hypothetical protein D9M71_736910 [compost metagenome]
MISFDSIWLMFGLRPSETKRIGLNTGLPGIEPSMVMVTASPAASSTRVTGLPSRSVTVSLPAAAVAILNLPLFAAVVKPATVMIWSARKPAVRKPLPESLKLSSEATTLKVSSAISANSRT